MKRWILSASMLVFACNAHANTITMIPLHSTDVVVGQTFSMDIVFDFTSDPNLFLYGGGFDIEFEHDALEFIGLTVDYVPDPAFSRPPDYYEGDPGGLSLLESWTVGSFDGIDLTGRFGTVHFRVRDTMPDSSFIHAQDMMTISPPWTCLEDGAPCFIFPEYNQITLTRVPLPSAAWLLVSGLLGLAVRRRSQTR